MRRRQKDNILSPDQNTVPLRIGCKHMKRCKLMVYAPAEKADPQHKGRLNSRHAFLKVSAVLLVNFHRTIRPKQG